MALMTLLNDSLFLFKKEPTDFADDETEAEEHYESFREMVSNGLEFWSEKTKEAVGVDRKRDIIRELTTRDSMLETWNKLSHTLRDDKDQFKVGKKELGYWIQKTFREQNVLTSKIREEFNENDYAKYVSGADHGFGVSITNDCRWVAYWRLA